MVRITKFFIIVIILAFAPQYIYGQNFMTLEDMIELSACKQNEACWTPILTKYNFSPDPLNQEIFKDSKNFNVFGLFKTKIYLEIKPKGPDDFNFVKLKTIKVEEAEKFYTTLFNNQGYEKKISDNYIEYVKEEKNKIINFFIQPIKIGTSNALQITVVLMRNTTKQLTQYESVDDITINDINGNAIPLSTFKGKHIILTFWSATCKYCIEEFPKLKKMVNELQPELKSNFEFVLVNTDENLNNWKKGIQKFGLQNFKNFHCGMDIYNSSIIAFNVSGTPRNVYVDKEGVMVTNRGHLFGEQAEQVMKIMYEVKK